MVMGRLRVLFSSVRMLPALSMVAPAVMFTVGCALAAFSMPALGRSAGRQLSLAGSPQPFFQVQFP
jgi:hypothetical protein